jgi:carnitine O-acetyltransferase
MPGSKRPLSTSKQRKSSSHDTPEVEGYTIDPNVGPTYAYQRSLPHLPVPSLNSTLSKYLETVQPHLTKEQYEKTKRVVEEFANSDSGSGSGIGKKLQERLELRAKDWKTYPNWLADWWNEAAYMGYRGTNADKNKSLLLRSWNSNMGKFFARSRRGVRFVLLCPR